MKRANEQPAFLDGRNLNRTRLQTFIADARLRAEHYEIALPRGGLEDRLQKSHRTTDMSSICDIQCYHI
jgi:hypothetical protein